MDGLIDNRIIIDFESIELECKMDDIKRILTFRDV